MTTLIELLAWTTAACFGLLGIAALRGWLRHRTRSWAALSLTVGTLGLFAIISRVSPLAGRPAWTGALAIVLFLLSGYGLLLFRHSLIPYRPRARQLAVLALGVVGIAALAARLPRDPAHQLSTMQLGVVIATMVVWTACVGEPALRFWRAARGRMIVQRRRLRALSLAYGGIAVVLLTAVAAAPQPGDTGLRLGMQLSALALFPAMAVAVAPPAWLRRRWRAHEQGALRAAIDELVRVSDERILAAGTLEWSLRLLGADSGFVVWSGKVLATRGIDPDAADLLSRHLSPPSIEPVAGGGYAISAPLGAGDAPGMIAVMANPLTPVFGREELDMLASLASSVSGALERLRLLEALRAESLRYQTLLDAISDLGVGVSILRDGALVAANEATLAMTGFSIGELNSMPNSFDLVPPEHRSRLADNLVRLFLREPGSEFWEMPIIRRDGERRELEGAAKLLEIDGKTHVLTISRDVTERHRANERDRRRAEQLAALADASKRLAGSRDLEELLPALAGAAMDVAHAEAAAVSLHQPGEPPAWFGPMGPIDPPADAVGVDDAVVAERRPVSVTRAGGALGLGGRHRAVLGIPLVRAGRLTGTILLMGRQDGQHPFDDLDESVAVSLALHAAEVIESARALARERALTSRLRQLDEIKNAFLAAVSHELRTPLTSVMGFAHTLERSGDMLSGEERATIVHRLTANAEKLERLLADLLDLDRLNRGIIEPVMRRTDLSTLILRAVEAFDFADGRPVHVDVAPVDVEVDAPKIERIIENLLANAVRHTTVGTPIWVRAQSDEGGVLIAVEDGGSGVPLALRERIFEPFQQGENVVGHAPGVGIGLSLVARFAALHGGRAWVTDREGGGASFRVWLPAAPRPARVGVGAS